MCADPLGPVFAARRGHGRSHRGENSVRDRWCRITNRPVAVVDRVLVLIFTRSDKQEARARIVRSQHPRLARRVAGRLHHDVLDVARAPRGQVEALVVILTKTSTSSLCAAPQHGAAKVLKLPLLLLVFCNGSQKERPIVRCPDDRTCPLDLARQRLAGLKILDAQRVLAKALGVGRVCQPAPVVRDVRIADRKKRMPLRELISVQHHFFDCARIRSRGPTELSAVDAILQLPSPPPVRV